MILNQGDTIGILGGGQLAQFLIIAAAKLGFKTVVFDQREKSPAFMLATEYICSAFSNKKALEKFSKMCTVITYEFENIPLSAIDTICDNCEVFPNREALRVGQDRFLEKNFAHKLGIKVPAYSNITDRKSLIRFLINNNQCGLLKTRTCGYDGKGQMLVHGQNIKSEALRMIETQECIVEEFVEFESELSIIAARGFTGAVNTYDPSINFHQDGILIRSKVPAPINQDIQLELALEAGRILTSLNYIGVIGIEFFLTKNGLLFNEFAPRVHNSGHWTLDGCLINQFEQHIRAISGWSLGSTKRHSDIAMTNIIGNAIDDRISEGKSIYNYGKDEVLQGRKMGHVNEII